MKDLFDGDTPIIDKQKLAKRSKYQKWKYRNEYRKAVTNELRCLTCANHFRVEYHNKRYHKCILLGDSFGSATDVRISFICNQFKKQT